MHAVCLAAVQCNRLTQRRAQTFVLAGHETSAAMLTWSLLELTRNAVRPPRAWACAERAAPERVRAPQELEAKVRAEAAAVFRGKAVPAREAVDTMDYTLATLKEVLRLYSVVPVVTRVTVVRMPARLAHAACLPACAAR
jgi:cytochrome P450